MSTRRPICLNTIALLNQTFSFYALFLACCLSNLHCVCVTGHLQALQN